MTAPAAPALTDAQLRQLRVLVGPDAWAAHDRLDDEDEQVNTAAAFEVYGSLKLVAADILELVCRKAQGQGVEQQGEQVKRMKIDGEYEEEYFQGSTVHAVNASAWCAKAERYRKEASLPGGARVVPSPLAGAATGSRPEPVFTVCRPDRENV